MSDSKIDNDDPCGSSDEEDGKGGKGSGKSRRELPSGAVSSLKAWLLSPEHFTHPYPTPQDQVMLMQKTGIDKKQLKNWFTNARRRIWKPMLKKQLESGKLAATGAGGGGVAVPGVVPGLMVQMPGSSAPGAEGGMDNHHSAQAMHAHYHQAVQLHGQPPDGQPQLYDQYGNPIFAVPQQVQQPASGAQPDYSQQYYAPQQPYGQPLQGAAPVMAPSSSIGSLPPMAATSGAPTNITAPTMSKTDSHAVLMELFARDQDLVRQATESAKMKKVNMPGSDPNQPQQVASQHPMKMGSQTRLTNSQIPTLNSWPHFSSISSLNNLGTMTGVKSITSMSGADLASQGNLNKMGNLAQVKSMESMGKNDSYAFLEVFFGDRSMSNMNMAGKDQPRGVKREREEDNDVGLSLDADEPPSATTSTKSPMEMPPARAPGVPIPAPLPPKGKDPSGDTGTLKRAYDDALAARGLMSVSRSSENLSDLALPAKMQRTLSQNYLRQHQAQAQAVQQQQQLQQMVPPQQYGQYSYASVPAPDASTSAQAALQSVAPSSQQYPGQHPQQQHQAPASGQQFAQQHTHVQTAPSSDTNTSGEVHVPSASTCARCHATGVDTQLRPCGHMFHERCLKPTLQVPAGQPKCPIDNIPILSALLAVPTDENVNPQPHVQQQHVQQWRPAPTPSYQSVIPAESSISKA